MAASKSKHPRRSQPVDNQIDSQNQTVEQNQQATPQTAQGYVSPQQGVLELDRIGEILKRVREQRGEALEEIADYLRIRPVYLKAMEDSRYEDLPADAYVIGFLRTYANYLGLDGRAAIDQYRKEMAGRRRKPHLSMPQPVSEGQAPTAPVIIGAILVALLVYILWYSLSGSEKSVEPPPVLPSAAISAPALAEKTTNGTLPTVGGSGIPVPLPPEALPTTASSADDHSQTNAEPAPQQNDAMAAQQPVPPQPDVLTIKAIKESWILITDPKGSTIYDHVLKQDEVYQLPDQKGLKLTTGNASGIQLSLNGKTIDVFEKNAHVIRSMAIDIEKWKK